MKAQPRHFLDLTEIETEELRAILSGSLRIKQGRDGVRVRRGEGLLAGKVLAMIFDQPSTRTRISFDVGMRELAAHATVPVINGLTKRTHPCQIMADVLTFEEKKGTIAGRRVAWTGDSNNVLASWVHASAKLDFEIRIATPPELAPPNALIEHARSLGAEIRLTDDPFEAVKGADCVVTDCWVSMGDEDEGRRHNLLKPYQVNARLMREADPDALFMHCLPAHRGEEVTSEVMDGPQSVVFDEAENRLHAQKGILAWCFGALPGG